MCLGSKRDSDSFAQLGYQKCSSASKPSSSARHQTWVVSSWQELIFATSTYAICSAASPFTAAHWLIYRNQCHLMKDRIYSPSPYNSLRIEPGSNCIRLLNIHPPITEGDNHRIQCDIVVADLASHPYFTALSYVWGAFAPDPHKILCGNAEIPISTNGYSALLLRKRLGTFTI